jgi:hypothetical protein
MAVRTNILLKLSNFVDSLITFAKLQNIATNKILGRTTAGSGVIEELDIANYSNKLIPLTTTYADCENTTSEIDIITVTVPANSLAVGDIIKIEISGSILNNTGSAVNLTQRLKVAGTTIVSSSNSVSASSSLYYIKHILTYYVTNLSGNNIDIVQNNTASGGVALTDSIALAFATQDIRFRSTTTHTPATIDRTTSNTFLATMQWASASVNAYVRVQQAQAYIIKKAV